MNTKLADRIALYRSTSAPVSLLAAFFMRGGSVKKIPPKRSVAKLAARTSLLRGA